MDGRIRYIVMPNKRYNYNEEDVYKFLNKGIKRRTVMYTRVPTPEQKIDLQNQIEKLKQWCFMNGSTISARYSDVVSRISFDEGKGFFVMLKEIMDNRVKRVIMTYKDELSHVGYDLFKHIVAKFRTDITVISEVGDANLDLEKAFANEIQDIGVYPRSLSIKKMITSKGDY